MAIENLSKGNDDGTSFGLDANDPVGFHGATSVQAAAITGPGTTAATTTTPYGFATSTQADAVTSAIAAILTAISGKGITA